MNPAALDAYVCGLPRGWDYVSFNCCHFVDGWVRLNTGRSPMAVLIAPTTALGMNRLRRKLGPTLADAVDKVFKPSMPVERARFGDLMLLQPWEKGKHGEVLGICTGDHVMVLMPLGAVALASRSYATHAWSLE